MSNRSAFAWDIVRDIEADLRGRRGLRQEWEQIDAATQSEIRQALVSIVDAALKKWEEAPHART